MKTTNFIFILLLLASCSGVKPNTLIGTWQSNEKMTLQSMHEIPEVSEKAKVLFEHDFFGKLINEYGPKNSKSYYKNSSENYEGIDKPSPYKIIEETNEYYIISNYNNALNKYETLTLFKEGSCYYVLVTKWKFREYFCRIEKPL